MKYRKISEYVEDAERYIPVDSGEVLTQPNLSLSVKDILDRWRRDMPLDIVTRNGSYMLPPDVDPDDDDYETEDLDRLDPVEAKEYMEQREQRTMAVKLAKQRKQREATNHDGASVAEGATEAKRSGAEGATEASETR